MVQFFEIIFNRAKVMPANAKTCRAQGLSAVKQLFRPGLLDINHAEGNPEIGVRAYARTPISGLIPVISRSTDNGFRICSDALFYRQLCEFAGGLSITPRWDKKDSFTRK